MSGFETWCLLETTPSVVSQSRLFLNTYVNLRCKIRHVFISVTRFQCMTVGLNQKAPSRVLDFDKTLSLICKSTMDG